ncbi:MAG: MFS transporter [Actinomycetales bacterium]|nr:MAG: MFS transporter [Actinomycetales bacterium]
MQQKKRLRARQLLSNKSSKALLPSEVYVLSVVAFFVALGYGMIIPAIPLFAKTFHVNNAQIGAIISAFALARFGMGLPAGKLIDLFGERRVQTTGLLIVAISTFASGLANSYWQLLTYRALGGIGSVMFSVSASSLLMRSVDDSIRGRAQSTFNGGFLIGGIAGPAIGGILSVVSLRVPFFAYAFTLVCAAFVTSFFLAENRLGKSITNKQDPADRILLRDALKSYPYIAAMAISFLSNWVLFGLRNSILPLFAKENLGASNTTLGLGFTVAAVVQGIALVYVGKLSDFRGRKFALMLGSFTLLSGVATIIISSHWWYYFLAMVFFGIGGAFEGTAASAVVGDLFGGKGGRVIALFQMAGDFGNIISPVLLGWLVDAHSYRPAFIATAAVFSLTLLLSAKMPETRKLIENN